MTGRAGHPDPVSEQLLRRRILLLAGRLDDAAAQEAAARAMLADAEGTEPLRLRISCPDGEPAAALLLADTLRLMRAPVVATATGLVGGPAVAVYAAAGHRTASAHAAFRLVEHRAEFRGPAAELASAAALHRDEADRLAGLIAAATGRDPARVTADLRAGTLLSAADAVGYGLVHELA